MQIIDNKIRINIIFVLFGLSGFSGLIYESVWTHYIKLILGHAAYAQTLVLVTFMGGLALGAWLVSRFSHRLDRPIIWYVAAEFILGIFGILFHYEFLGAHELLFTHLLPNIESPLLASTSKWLVASIILLPQALLLGTTFPLIGAAIVRFTETKPGNTLSLLYFSNSFGAVFGILVSGFILIEMVGLPGTSLTAGLVNIVVAIAIWLVIGGYSGSLSKAPLTTIKTPSSPEERHQSKKILLMVAFLTGLSSFFYEIGWIRMLSQVLGSSMQAFELMLAAFILGLAAGGLYIRKRADSQQEPIMTIGWIQIAMGFFALATLVVYAESFDAMAFLFSALNKTDNGYILFNVSSALIAIAVMVPATFMAGMTLPLITTTLFKSGDGESSIGHIYTANTIGAIIGIVLAVNLLMPVIGATNLIVLGGFIDIAVGIYLIFSVVKNNIRLPRYSIPISLFCIGSILFSLTPFDKSMLASGVYRFGISRITNQGVPIFYKDGKTASVSLIEYPNGSKSITTNGKSDALFNPLNKPAGGDEITMVMLGVLPMLYKPNLEYVANIGLGSGLTTHLLLGSTKIKRIDTIEIEKEMMNGAKYFGDRVRRAFEDKRSHIHIDDAKSYFSSRNFKYDAIISEPSNPWVSGVSSLFTKEYYKHIKQYLQDDGVFVQWLQLYEINLKGVASVLKAIDSEFPHYRVFSTTDGDLIIIASQNQTLDRMKSDIFSNTLLASDMSRVGLETKKDFTIRLLGDEKILSTYINLIRSPVNSDYFPYLSYAAPRSRYKTESATELSRLHIAGVPIINWLNKKNSVGKVSKLGSHFDYYAGEITAKNIVNRKLSLVNKIHARWAATHIESRTFKCNPSAYGKHDDIEALVVVGSSINAFIEQKSLSTYWHRLAQKCSAASSSNLTKKFLMLEWAIAMRDNKKTIRLTSELLSKSNKHPKEILNHLITARLVAVIDSGDKQAEIEMVKKYKLNTALNTLNLPLQLLVSIAITESSGDQQK